MLRLVWVGGDWWRAGHVTTVLASDWPGDVEAGLGGRARPRDLAGLAAAPRPRQQAQPRVPP